MKSSHLIRYSRMAVTAAMAGAAIAHAATVTAVQQDKNWDLATTWSDGQAPSPANDYVVGSNASFFAVRTNGNTFSGNSLTFQDTASFFKIGGGTGNPTANVFFNVNTTIQVLTAGVTLEGTLHVANGVMVRTDATANNRAINIASTISGGGTFSTARLSGTAPVNNSNNVTFSSSNTTFTGNWELNAPSFFTAIDSLGSFSSITIGGYFGARLDANYDVTRTSASLIINSAVSLSPGDNGKIVLDQNFTFGSVTIGGTALGTGTYTQSQLTDLGFGAFISGTGNGTLTVAPIPEPSSFAMIAGLGGLGLVIVRRRR